MSLFCHYFFQQNQDRNCASRTVLLGRGGLSPAPPVRPPLAARKPVVRRHPVPRVILALHRSKPTWALLPKWLGMGVCAAGLSVGWFVFLGRRVPVFGEANDALQARACGGFRGEGRRQRTRKRRTLSNSRMQLRGQRSGSKKVYFFVSISDCRSSVWPATGVPRWGGCGFVGGDSHGVAMGCKRHAPLGRARVGTRRLDCGVPFSAHRRCILLASPRQRHRQPGACLLGAP